MRKISEAARDIVLHSEMACLALEQGCLNLSKYAATIQKEIEKRTKKPASIGSIVTALSRIELTEGFSATLQPKLHIYDVSVKSGLVEAAYEKTKEHIRIFNALYCNRDVSTSDFFMFTQGSGEIAVVAMEQVLPTLLEMFKPSKPKIIIRELAGLTLRFREDDVQTPNLLHSLLQHLATEQLNIIELVSTYTELTLLLAEKDIERAFSLLNALSRNAS